MSRRIFATHRITTVPLDGWDNEHLRFLDLRAGRVPFGTGLSSFGSSLLRSLAGSRFNPSRKEKV